MDMFIGVMGMLTLLICLVLFVISFFNEKIKKKKVLTGMGCGFIAFIVGVSMTPTLEESSSVSNSQSVSVVNDDKVAQLELELAELRAENEDLKNQVAELTAQIEAADIVQESTKETITLTNGNYFAGEDFESGVYHVVATKGKGTVYSSNHFSGGVNALMASDEDEYYQKEYKNIRLPEGTELRVDGVTIDLIPIE